MAGDREGSVVVRLEFRKLPQQFIPVPTDAIRGRRLNRFDPGELVGALNRCYSTDRRHTKWPELMEWALYQGKLYHLEIVNECTATFYEEPDFKDMGSE